MIGGAGAATLGDVDAAALGAWSSASPPPRLAQSGQLRNGRARLLIGLSTFQAEFDFGVPQFQLLYQPMLIAFAAGLALVCARSLLGRGGALGGAGDLLRRARRPGAHGRRRPAATRVPHFPLYLAEALLVEAAGLLLARAAPAALRRCSRALLIGTVGLAAEWGWSHVWMPLPWPAALLPEAPS